MRSELESFLPFIQQDENPTKSGFGEILVSAIVFASGSPKTSVDVYKSPYRPSRSAPLRKMAVPILQENLVLALRSAQRISEMKFSNLETTTYEVLQLHPVDDGRNILKTSSPWWPKASRISTGNWRGSMRLAMGQL